MKIASHINIPPSATLAMNALAAQKKNNGEIVYNLTVGEPMIDTPEVIRQAAQKAMDEGKTLYTPPAGIPQLREASAEWINTTFGSSYTTDNAIVTCGGKHGLLMTLQALLEPQDEVLIIAPYWVSYPSMVSLCGGVAKIISTSEEKNWKILPEDIAAACSSKTKILILNNGGNPTGVLYTKEEIQNILKIAEKKNLIVISDEVYSGLVYDNKQFVSVASFAQYQENTIIIQSCSKHFAMTGWRVGFVFGPAEFITTLETLQSQSTTGTSSISQWAALAAIQNADTLVPQINSEMQIRRDAFVQNFKKYFGLDIVAPSAGLYAFISMNTFGIHPDVRSGLGLQASETDSLAWCMQILQEANVVFVPGAPFGAEGYVRASFGVKIGDVEAGLKQLSLYLKKF